MVAVITGDIVNSQSEDNPALWLAVLKKTLRLFGERPQSWDIYRGDSFQLELSDPRRLIEAFLLIKSALKTFKTLDVRMAAGIGTKHYTAEKVSESNGDAFILSGTQFDDLKKEKSTLLIQSNWDEFDKEVNLFLRFALISIDSWSTASAELVYIMLTQPHLSQQEIGSILGISQSSVSERQSRSNINELLALNDWFRLKLNKLITKRI